MLTLAQMYMQMLQCVWERPAIQGLSHHAHTCQSLSLTSHSPTISNGRLLATYRHLIVRLAQPQRPPNAVVHRLTSEAAPMVNQLPRHAAALASSPAHADKADRLALNSTLSCLGRAPAVIRPRVPAASCFHPSAWPQLPRACGLDPKPQPQMPYPRACGRPRGRPRGAAGGAPRPWP